MFKDTNIDKLKQEQIKEIKYNNDIINSNNNIDSNINNINNTNNAIKSSFNNGRWTKEEHFKFINACLKYGSNWKKVKKFNK